MFQNSSNRGINPHNHFKKPKAFGGYQGRMYNQGQYSKIREVRHLTPGQRNHYMTTMGREESITVGVDRKMIQEDIVGEHQQIVHIMVSRGIGCMSVMLNQENKNSMWGIGEVFNKTALSIMAGMAMKMGMLVITVVDMVETP